MQHVVSQLLTKRQELAGEVLYYQKKIEELNKQVMAIDTSIAIFDPEFTPKGLKVKRFSPKKRYFAHGESMILIFDLLRKVGEPLATADIVKAIMEKKGLDIANKELYSGISGTIRARLYDYEKKGILSFKSDGPGKDGYWSIKSN